MRSVRCEEAMKMCRGTGSAVLVAAIACIVSAGGVHAGEKAVTGIDFMLGIPSGGFRDSLDDTGYGMSVYGAGALGDSPVYIGGEIGFMVYGVETREQKLSSEIPEINIEVQTTNSILVGHFLMRIQSPNGRVRPYADVLVGVKYLFTSTTVSGESSESFASTLNFDDAAFSIGGGGGLQVQLNDPDSRVAICLDARLRYLWGGTAEYLKEGSLRREHGEVIYDVSKSQTSMLLPLVGIAIRF